MSAIVGAGRDLVLTPKQSLQSSGKRIYYEEQPTEAVVRSWERTLKHVTYVTLFTDAAVGAAAGNLSQLHDYHNFLQTPYMPLAVAQTQLGPARFGDIVTLASGRLEQFSANGSYRFVEGSTDAQQMATAGIQTRALWRVQRIRHRDGGIGQSLPQRFHYELKFSVSPLAANIGWPPQSYIQKESDYPQSFGRQVYEQKREQELAQRRQDRQPQATFMHGIFQPPPPPPPLPPLLPPNLNIGEYLKQGIPKGTPKIEQYPGLYNLGLRPNFIPATTFRPGGYPVKFGPRPELPAPPEPYPLPNELGSGGGPANAASVPANPTVTHHFHHHFYMTPNGLVDGGVGSGGNHAELGYRPPAYVAELSTPAPPTRPPYRHSYPEHYYESHRELQLPTNREPASAESLEPGEDEHQDQEQHPQIYTGYEEASKHDTSTLAPLLIYAGAAADAEEEQKSFVQSEPLEETVYRYSEPDPLYVHQHPVDILQLESPHSYESDEPLLQRRQQQQQQQHPGQLERGTSSEQQEDGTEDGTEDEETAELPSIQTEQRPAGSQKQPKLATTAAAVSSTGTENATATTAAAATTTTTTAATTTTTSTSMAPPRAAATSRASFVSTSTSITPLRALSRYRTTPRITAGRSTTTTTTTTTEQPAIAKWKQRRKENATSMDSRAKSSHRHESKVAFVPTTAATAATTTTIAPTTTAPTTTTSSPAVNSSALPAGEIIEVLTQKSVSKSVSIKVGENGEEIPIIVDDDENEVKKS